MKDIGVIFDCDGTLLDSIGMWRELEIELARRAQVQLAPEDTRLLGTLTIPETAQYFHDHFGLGATGAQVVDMIDEFALDYYRHRAKPRPGALAFVEALAQRDVAMSVASSSPQSYLQAGLAQAGLLEYMCAVVSVEDVGASKREPAVYHQAREVMGTSLPFSWGVEDSIYAVRTLACAGYGVVGIYDSDDSATWDELVAESSIAIRSFTELEAEDFCQAALLRAGA